MSNTEKDDLRPEYDFRDLGEGVRGKYQKRYEEGANVVVIEPDLVKVFPNAEAVNEALRELLSRRQERAS